MVVTTVHLWLNLARSGGTLLARCLGCMRDIALLSEAHPLGTRLIDPTKQAAEWHALLSDPEAARARRMRYDELIADLAGRAETRGKTLLLRDWSHLDFLGVPFTEPSFTSRSRQLLAMRHEVRCFATVRHPADQWASQQRLDLLRGGVDPARYLEGCRAFAALAAEVGFVRYEDFTVEPDARLEEICTGLGVPFDSTWSARYASYDRVTGDPEASQHEVGKIRPARRRSLDAQTRRLFLASANYAEACRVLGYDPEIPQESTPPEHGQQSPS